jgi:SAM-dependent methyltransferase
LDFERRKNQKAADCVGEEKGTLLSTSGPSVIPNGATVVSVDSHTQVHISENATGTATGVGLQFGGAYSPPTQLFGFRSSPNSWLPPAAAGSCEASTQPGQPVLRASSGLSRPSRPPLHHRCIFSHRAPRQSHYPQRSACRLREMENLLFFPMVNDIIMANSYQRVLDLGCGDGTFLRMLCGLNPEVQCFGIDLAPTAVEEGNRVLREAGLQDRVHLQALDISKIDQAGLPAIDAATVFFVLHELLYFGEDVLLNFLKDFRRLFPGTPLIAFEAVRPPAEDLRRHPGISVYYFLYHDLTQQKPVDADTWKYLFRKAGFESIEERQLDFAKAAIYILK